MFPAMGAHASEVAIGMVVAFLLATAAIAPVALVVVSLLAVLVGFFTGARKCPLGHHNRHVR